uniref:Transposase n=1 Tax=Angiostrongylus cantonensis TaxID=6313 RepID=A0A0K0DDL6_ANGCA
MTECIYGPNNDLMTRGGLPMYRAGVAILPDKSGANLPIPKGWAAWLALGEEIDSTSKNQPEEWREVTHGPQPRPKEPHGQGAEIRTAARDAPDPDSGCSLVWQQKC